MTSDAVSATSAPFDWLPVTGKVVCVGRNYAEHARELGNAVPIEPVLFIKPASSVRPVSAGIHWPPAQGECHFETELCVRVGSVAGGFADAATALTAIDAVTLGLDLTLRDVQTRLKSQGLPWERAKAFRGACVLGDWVDVTDVPDWLTGLTFALAIDDAPRQHGNVRDMLFGVGELLVAIDRAFGLDAGDVVMTGTPQGVGALLGGQRLDLTLSSPALGEHHWCAVVDAAQGV